MRATTICREDDGEADVELSARKTDGGCYIVETIDGIESSTIYLPNASHARLVALLAPEPTVLQIEAAAKALYDDYDPLINRYEDDEAPVPWEDLDQEAVSAYRLSAKAVLAAARAARQTGGANG